MAQETHYPMAQILAYLEAVSLLTSLRPTYQPLFLLPCPTFHCSTVCQRFRRASLVASEVRGSRCIFSTTGETLYIVIFVRIDLTCYDSIGAQIDHEKIILYKTVLFPNKDSSSNQNSTIFKMLQYFY